MFLEELKEEKGLNYYDGIQKYPPKGIENTFSGQTSIGSTANIEMIKQQEESFAKLQNEISYLNGKLRVLEERMQPQSKKIKQMKIENKENY